MKSYAHEKKCPPKWYVFTPLWAALCTRTMSNLFLSLISLFGFSAYMFLLYRWWFHHLVKLASNLNITQARKSASRHFFIIVLLFAIPSLSTFAWVIQLHALNKYLLVLLFAIAMAPSLIWWFKNWPTLRNLGYGRGSHA